MFASNFIMDKASMGLKQLYRLYAGVVADLPVAERRKLFQKRAQWIRRIDGH